MYILPCESVSIPATTGVVGVADNHNICPLESKNPNNKFWFPMVVVVFPTLNSISSAQLFVSPEKATFTIGVKLIRSIIISQLLALNGLTQTNPVVILYLPINEE